MLGVESLKVAIDAVVCFVVTGTYTYIDAEYMDLVELGIGKFSDSVKHFYIRENLVLACLMRWLSNPDAPMNIAKALNPDLRNPNPSPRGFSFENALIYLLWRYFTTPGTASSLNSLCSFVLPTPEPDWASQPAQLISHFDSEQRPVILQPGLATCLAVTGASSQDTIDWLKGRTRIPFFKPDIYMGPDVCFRVALRSPGSNRLRILLICVQCKAGTSLLNTLKTKHAIFSVSPERFYNGKGSVSRALYAAKYGLSFGPYRGGDLPCLRLCLRLWNLIPKKKVNTTTAPPMPNRWIWTTTTPRTFQTTTLR